MKRACFNANLQCYVGFFFFKLKTAITVHLLLHSKISLSAYPTHLPNIEMTTEGTNLSIPFPLLIHNSKISITF